MNKNDIYINIYLINLITKTYISTVYIHTHTYINTQQFVLVLESDWPLHIPLVTALESFHHLNDSVYGDCHGGRANPQFFFLNTTVIMSQNVV